MASGAELRAARGGPRHVVVTMTGDAGLGAFRFTEHGVNPGGKVAGNLGVARKTGGRSRLRRVGELRRTSVAVHALQVLVNALLESLRVHRDGLAPRVRQAAGRGVTGEAIIGRAKHRRRPQKRDGEEQANRGNSSPLSPISPAAHYGKERLPKAISALENGEGYQGSNLRHSTHIGYAVPETEDKFAAHLEHQTLCCSFHAESLEFFNIGGNRWEGFILRTGDNMSVGFVTRGRR
jgi:hypothetical protein